MDLSKATTQQILEFKSEWKPNAFTVNVNSNLDIKCKRWCMQNLERWEWSMDPFTENDKHSFFFLHEEDYDDFRTFIGQ